MRFVFVISILLFSCHSALSASGIYTTITAAGINDVLNQVTAEIQAQAPGIVARTPAMSGKTDKVEYTFSSFSMNLKIGSPYYAYTAPSTLNFGWKTFQFVMQWNYHVKVTSWPNPSESGYIQVGVYQGQNDMLEFSGILTTTSNTPTFSVTSSQLLFNAGADGVNVHCSNTVCLIPTSDIAQGVAKEFVPLLDQTMQKAINQAGVKVLSHINMLKTIPLAGHPGDSLQLNLEGGWQEFPNGNVMFAPLGRFAAIIHGQTSVPPYQPTTVPPTAVLQSPSRGLGIVLTDYLMNSLLWSLNQAGEFALTITSNEVPPSSPVKLSTNDGFFQSAVPGLTAYPNMNITVTTALNPIPVFTVTATDVFLSKGALVMTFSLGNSTYKHAGFVISASILMDMKFAVVQSGSHVILQGTMVNATSTTSQVSSAVGAIQTAAFDQLMQLVLPNIKIPPVTLPLPANFVVSSPLITQGTNYLALDMNYSFKI